MRLAHLQLLKSRNETALARNTPAKPLDLLQLSNKFSAHFLMNNMAPCGFLLWTSLRKTLFSLTPPFLFRPEGRFYGAGRLQRKRVTVVCHLFVCLALSWGQDNTCRRFHHLSTRREEAGTRQHVYVYYTMPGNVRRNSFEKYGFICRSKSYAAAASRKDEQVWVLCGEAVDAT